MGNINDYLKWRGDITFSSQYPYNEVDALVLARMSYLRFNMIDFKENDTVEIVSNKMKDIKNEDFLFNGDKELITLLGKSKRFKNLKITDYEEIFDFEIQKQFGAITIHLPNNIIYISYIGTDMTITGWKEDFNMAFMKEVPAQIDGLIYARKVAKKYPNHKIILGGHSKGGNVALYVALSLDKDIQDRIIEVNNYDGPGFDEKLITFDSNEEIRSKITSYIPQDSIIGRLFDHHEKHRIILSNAKGIMQHDIYSWNVLGTKLVDAESIEYSSELLNKTIKKWLNNCTIDEREALVDNIFELFYSTEVSTFQEFSKVWVKKLPTMMNTYKGLPEIDKKQSKEMLSKLFKSTFEIVKAEASEKIQSSKNKTNLAKKDFTN